MAEQQTWPCLGPIAVPAARSESDTYLAWKRVFDLLFAGLIALALSPLFLLIAFLIKLDSEGPVFFKQERVGTKRWRLGHQSVWLIEHFEVYKFRSMVRDADNSVHEAYIREFVEGRARATSENGGKFKLTNDARITRVGWFLRKFSLDELPQLFNVLKGEMSLVGPRPVPPYEVAGYREGHHQRLAAIPGITGIWQVNGRGRVTFEEMMRMDIEYVRRASFWLDLKILFLTIPAVISRKGAE
ncbi:MAG TPA: sugar transferase [Candidatus Acidoferrum sp.]|nr:sugar transferase [Candidatus Acidoferrum sp.]